MSETFVLSGLRPSSRATSLCPEQLKKVVTSTQTDAHTTGRHKGWKAARIVRTKSAARGQTTKAALLGLLCSKP